nr:hypothetical protein [Planctomycetota bacterium]
AHDGVLAGGVDSGIDADSLVALSRSGRAKSEHAPAGLVAGEGAAVVLIGRGGGGLAEIRQVADDAPDLTSAIASLMSDGARPTIGHVYSSMNGERRWAIEWATAATRHRDIFTVDPRLDHPAQAYGDLGAASGPALVALAALDRRRGTSLVYASGDDGLHAAALLTIIGD